jgi:hypothetical protein
MSDTGVPIERRTLTTLRAVFPAAFEALRPFFDPATRWSGQTHEHMALRTLKEQFPELSAQDSFVMVATAKRLYATGHYPPGSPSISGDI